MLPSMCSTVLNGNKFLSAEQIISVVDIELKNAEIRTVQEASVQSLKEINKNLQIVTGNSKVGFSSTDELVHAYKTALITNCSNKLEKEYGDDLSNKVAEVLKLDQEKPFSELSEQDKITVIESLLSDDIQIKSLPAFIATSDEKNIQPSRCASLDQSSTFDQKENKSTVYIYIIFVSVVIILIVISVIMKKR